jgi:hypothetical protein
LVDQELIHLDPVTARAGANQSGLEMRAGNAYPFAMDDNPTPAPVPTGWLEALARSEAQLAAGLTVPGEAVRQRLHAALARLEAKHAAEGPGHDAPPR